MTSNLSPYTLERTLAEDKKDLENRRAIQEAEIKTPSPSADEKGNDMNSPIVSSPHVIRAIPQWEIDFHRKVKEAMEERAKQIKLPLYIENILAKK